MPGFDFAAPARVVLAPGCIAKVGDALAELKSTRPLFVAGATSRYLDRIPAAGSAPRVCVPGEPTIDHVREGRALALAEGCDAVVAVGGGSAIDAGKAIAGLAGNPGDVLDYLEVVGQGKPLPGPGLPCIAVPSTAGTGAEVTKNAVLTSPQAQVKASVRSPHLLPAYAFVDPELLRDTPGPVLAATAMDALSHLIESFVSRRANPLSTALARDGIARSRRALSTIVAHGLNDDACMDLALASVFGGLCLANSGLGAVHGFAAPLGGRWKAPHGVVCAALLPGVMRTNLLALRARDPNSIAVQRYGELDALFGGDAARWVAERVAELAIPGLGTLGIAHADLPVLVAKAKAASSMRGNPIDLTDEELTAIAAGAMGG